MKTIKIEWNLIDFRSCAENVGYDLTDKQLSEIMDIVEAEHDASIGINFDVIGQHIGMYMSELEENYE